MDAKWGWLVIGGVVVVWDFTQTDQLTHAFRRAPRPLTLAVSGIVVAHLYNVLPRWADPLRLILRQRKV